MFLTTCGLHKYLSVAQQVYTKEDFQVEWCLQSPELEELVSDASLLKGILMEVSDSSGKGKHSSTTVHLHYLPVEDLPSDANVSIVITYPAFL